MQSNVVPAAIRWGLALVFSIATASGLAAQQLSAFGGAGVGQGVIDGQETAAFSVGIEYPVGGHWAVGIRYGSWHWGLMCYADERCSSGDALTVEGRHRFGSPDRAFRPFLGAGIGGMEWSVRKDRIVSGALFGGGDLTWGVVVFTVELRHQMQGIYSGNDPLTALNLGIGLRWPD